NFVFAQEGDHDGRTRGRSIETNEKILELFGTPVLEQEAKNRRRVVLEKSLPDLWMLSRALVLGKRRQDVTTKSARVGRARKTERLDPHLRSTGVLSENRDKQILIGHVLRVESQLVGKCNPIRRELLLQKYRLQSGLVLRSHALPETIRAVGMK